uniref:Uncharacterized protein n=1 Tax=viral metagenome TaxID=1070528 RepID=A0A6C0KPY0_9ZZZZ
MCYYESIYKSAFKMLNGIKNYKKAKILHYLLCLFRPKTISNRD